MIVSTQQPLVLEEVDGIRELRPDLVSQLSVARARKSEAEKLEAALTLRLKELMAAENILTYAPAGSQLKLQLVGTPTANVPWKEVHLAGLRRRFPKSWTEKLRKLRKKYTETVIKLELQLNEKHSLVGKPFRDGR